MDKPVITEKLINSYEIEFCKSKTTVNEYSSCLTKEEIEINRLKVQGILAKVFGKNEN
uniref:hypothetical protein n=1 Tax=Eubacterium sp. TaxID=142586 RepID=UPI004029AD1E